MDVGMAGRLISNANQIGTIGVSMTAVDATFHELHEQVVHSGVSVRGYQHPLTLGGEEPSDECDCRRLACTWETLDARIIIHRYHLVYSMPLINVEGQVLRR